MLAQQPGFSGLAIEVVVAHAKSSGPEAIEALADVILRFLDVVLPASEAHRFQSFGSSLVRFGADGRLAIHSWPERGVVTVDVWAASWCLVARARALLDRVRATTAAEIRGARLLEADGSIAQVLA